MPENFKKGVKRTSNAGRKPGIPNKTNQLLRDAMMLAAEQVGYMHPSPPSDGEDDDLDALRERWQWFGEDGVIGFLRFCAVHWPRDYLRALTRLLPLQVHMKSEETKTFRTVEEIRAEIISRGLPLDNRLLLEFKAKAKASSRPRIIDYYDEDDDYDDNVSLARQ